MTGKLFGEELRNLAAIANQRCLVALQGELNWATDIAHGLCGDQPTLWFNQKTTSGRSDINPSNVRQFLGQDISNVVFNAYDNFDCEAFGILSGAITGGNLLILIWPQHQSAESIDRHYKSDYLRRCRRLVDTSHSVVNIRQGQLDPFTQSLDKIFLRGTPLNTPNDISIGTTDQTVAIDAVRHVVNGQRKRPAVLISDRGRGKSAALGIAAGQLVDQGVRKIVVTGQSSAAVAGVLRHYHATNPSNPECIEWRSVDQLRSHKIKCDLLLIDEAAGIPLHHLEALLGDYSRIAMATTVHGYEGTGQGFMLRFSRTLNRLTRGWKKVELIHPIRWAKDDSLEQITNQLLLLDCKLTLVNSEQIAESTSEMLLQSSKVTEVTQQELVENESLLRRIFSLLVLAHYKTQPKDLQQLLDNQNLRIFQLYSDNQNCRTLVGVALVIAEGGLDTKLSDEIYLGKRRPSGQVLPEILSSQLGQPGAANLTMARIMRIVVHPDFQTKGFGSKLITYVFDQFKENSDLIGTHFSASPALGKFWRKNKYSPVRISHSIRPQSGSHSMVYLRSFSGAGTDLLHSATESFWNNFPVLLKTDLKHFDPYLVAQIFQCQDNDSYPLPENLIGDLQGYLFGSRPAESIPQALSQLVARSLADNFILDSVPDHILLIERVMQGKPWSQCQTMEASSGKQSGRTRVHHAASVIYQRLVDESVLG